MNKTKLPSIISVLILTLITVVMWVSLDIYRAIKKPTQITVPTEISQQLTPTLDQDSIKLIETRNFLDDSQIPNSILITSQVSTSTATPSATMVPISENPVQTVNASGSGTTP
jgi:hypothetical protein